MFTNWIDMYTYSIFIILSWPLLIFLCWIAIRIALVFYENKEQRRIKEFET